MKIHAHGKFMKRLAAAYRAFQNSGKKPEPAPQTAPPVKPLPPPITKKQPAETVADLKTQYCCGCGTCFNSCPVDAISMTHDSMGYLVPFVDPEKCIHCGLCVKKCPVLSPKYENRKEPDCYAVMANDEIRQKSSSGGVFSLVADYVFRQGGYVCGAALADDLHTVEHVIISSPEEMDRLRGSKYVQSDTGKIYTEIRELLQQGKLVLFTGCPCQVAGLDNFLGKPYDNLIKVDLVCHGGPSMKVFTQYLEESYGVENLKDFKFRTKKFGYNSFHQIAYLKDGSEIAGSFRFDPYEKAMHSGVGLKDICGDCPFAEAPRQGDITMGDFWGVTKYKKELGDNLGTSVLLVNNDKGAEILEQIKPNMKLIEPVPFSHARANNRFGRKMNIPSGRRWFYNMLGKQPFAKAVEYSLNRKFDVGVIGLWFGLNYGSMATYYALHYVLTHMGLSVLMIENCLKPQGADANASHCRQVAEDYYDVSNQYRVADLSMLNNHCDTFIVGSDQLWNVGLSRPYGQTYFLGFAGESNKKIAYGTSFAKRYAGTEEEKLISGYNLRRFDHVSVRDQISEEECRNVFGIENVVQVCDPTFLCPMEGYEELAARADLKEEDPYILAYILDPNPEIGKQLEQLASLKKKKLYVILDEYKGAYERNIERLELSENSPVQVVPNIGLYEWIWYYKNASAVVTDSFHGTIFSIIFQKPFISLMNQRRGGQRFVSLLEPISLMDRLFETPDAICANERLLDAMDYTEANKKLDAIREKSRKWLENALYSPKEVKSKSIYPSFDSRLKEEM